MFPHPQITSFGLPTTDKGTVKFAQLCLLTNVAPESGEKGSAGTCHSDSLDCFCIFLGRLNSSLIHESFCGFNIHCVVLGFFAGADNGGTASGGTSGIPPSNPTGNSKSAARNLGSSAGEKEEGKKVRRQWESWSTEDKNTFFEGLYEVHVEENNHVTWFHWVCEHC